MFRYINLKASRTRREVDRIVKVKGFALELELVSLTKQEIKRDDLNPFKFEETIDRRNFLEKAQSSVARGCSGKMTLRNRRYSILKSESYSQEYLAKQNKPCIL